MADLQIEPPDESEQESIFETIILRFGAAFLCSLFGLISALLGYGFALSIDLELEKFNTYTSVYFSITLVLWILIGLTTPFSSFKRFFESFKGMTAGRAVVILLGIGAFIVLHWYVLSFATELFVSVFGT
ncbi:MAG: hypothetical protein ABR936_02570 [Bacteroidota bacterium]